MDPEERAEFLQELESSAAEADTGQLIDAADVLGKLRCACSSRKTTCHVHFEVDAKHE